MLTWEEAEDLAFWRRLLPAHGVEAGAAAPPATLPDVAGLLELLRCEAYLNEPGVLDAALVSRLAAAVATLVARGLPPVFVWIHDEPWTAYRSLAPLLAAALGADYRVPPKI